MSSIDIFSYPYFDESLDIETRLADLISRMSIEEKVNQLTCTYGFAGVIDRNDLKNGIGQISMSSGSLSRKDNISLIRDTQRFLLQETRLRIPALFHLETLNGLALKSMTVYPVPLALAATWNPDLVNQMATEMAENLEKLSIQIALAPVLDIARDPRWGRISETYGESTYLVSQMGKSYIKGLRFGQKADKCNDQTSKTQATSQSSTQSTAQASTQSIIQEKVNRLQEEKYQKEQVEKSIPCAKHFIAYAMGEAGLNMSQIHFGEREIRETYATPFETAIKEAGLPAVMNAYSAIDGEPILATSKYLNQLLRDNLSFKGLTISDYASINMLNNIYYIAKDMAEAGKIALESGLDTETPTPTCLNDAFVERIKNGEYDENILGRALYNILKLKFEMGLFDECFRESILNTGDERALTEKIEKELEKRRKAELETSLELARQSIVLLKNTCLPIKPHREKRAIKIALIGQHAKNLRALFGSYTYPSFYEGMKSIFDDLNANMGQEGMNLSLEAKMALRSQIRDLPELDDLIRESYPGIQTILDAITSLIKEQRMDESVELLFAEAISVRGEILADLDEARKIASLSDYTIFCCGGISGSSPDSTMGENVDSASIGLVGDFEPVALDLAKLSKNFILLHMDGRPLSSAELFSTSSAILELWHPGEMGAMAIAETIFGLNNPSAKLPLSLLRNSGQIPLYLEQKKGSGAIGRGPAGDGKERNYFDISSLPLRAFGYGLTYSEFELSDFSLPSEISATDDFFELSFSLKNISELKGREVVQIYCRDLYASLPRPLMSLLAFCKLELEADEKKYIKVKIPMDLLAFLNKDMKWVIEDGEFEIMLATSSDNIICSKIFKLYGTRILPEGRQHFSSTFEIV